MNKITKLTKITITIMTVLCMLVSFYPSIMATATSSPAKGTITITNDSASSGISISGKQFSVYQVLSLTDTTYTVTDAFTSYFTGSMTGGDSNNYDCSNITGVIDYIQSYASDMDTFTKALQTHVSTTSPTATKVETVSNGDESITFTELDDGYYFILDTTGTIGADTVRVAAAIDTLSGDTGITINVKGSAPTIEKENRETTTDSWGNGTGFAIGDTVYYRLTATMPKDITGYETYYYVISDTMDDGITYTANTIKFWTDADCKTALTPATYSITTDESPTAGTFEITFEGIAALKTANINTVYITYEGTINEKAVSDLQLENNVTLTYSSDPYDSDETGQTSDVVYHQTFQLEVTKTEDDGSTALANAEFQLWDKVDNQVITLSQDSSDSTKYYIDANGAVDTITTGSTGKFTIIGLDDETAYILKETKAPENYNAVDDLEFTITASYNADGTLNTSSVSNTTSFSINSDTVSTTVINTSISLLPSTGGIGTVIFRIVGVLLIVGGVGLFIYQKRKKHTIVS